MPTGKEMALSTPSRRLRVMVHQGFPSRCNIGTPGAAVAWLGFPTGLHSRNARYDRDQRLVEQTHALQPYLRQSRQI